MIEVVATKWICDQSPEGTVLTLPDQDALVLIEMGMVRRKDDAPARKAPAEPAPKPAEPVPAVPDTQAPEPPSQGRRSYRRRDMAAEGETTSKGEPQAGE